MSDLNRSDNSWVTRPVWMLTYKMVYMRESVYSRSCQVFVTRYVYTVFAAALGVSTEVRVIYNDT